MLDASGKVKFVFQCRINSPSANAPMCAATVCFDEFDPTSIDVELLDIGPEGSRLPAANAIGETLPEELCLFSVDPSVPSAKIRGVTNAVFDGPRTVVKALEVLFGFDETVTAPVKYTFVVQLQPSGILSRDEATERKLNGEIARNPLIDGEVTIPTSLGEFEARKSFSWSQTVEFGNHVEKAIRRATIHGDVVLKESETLESLDRRLEREIDPILVALSLCYRQAVDYYQIEYFRSGVLVSYPQKGNPLKRRRLASIKTKEPVDELINTRNLVNGGLSRLVSKLRAPDAATILSEAIPSLLSSYHAPLDPGYFLAFSAMESVLSSCAKDSALTSGEKKKVERRLKCAIEELDFLDSITRDAMKRKLPELARQTLHDRVAKACIRYGPKTDDLWPGLSFLDGIAKALKIRNKLVHLARVEDHRELSADLTRIQIFTERLILKMIQWPDDEIWVWHDQHLRWINKNGE